VQNYGYSAAQSLLESVTADFEILPAANDSNHEVDILLVAVLN